jgi:hypothetical protein
MQNNVKIDFITVDKTNNEFVMYLVEDGPWPEGNLENRLLAIQDRIYNAVDVAIERCQCRLFAQHFFCCTNERSRPQQNPLHDRSSFMMPLADATEYLRFL